MNYEVKSVSPGSVFLECDPYFPGRGFVVAIISFFIVPNPNIHITVWWQKIMATLLFTVVYAVVVSIVLMLIGWLYNLWAGQFKGITIQINQLP